MKLLKTKTLLLVLALAVGLSIIGIGCAEHPAEKADPEHGHKEGEHGHEEEGEEHEGGGIRLSAEALKEAGIVVEILTPRVLTSTVELPGTLTPHPDGEGLVGSLVEGRIDRVFVDVGDRVGAGTALCTIESPAIGEAEASYITALADHQFVKADLERHKTLTSEGIGSKKDLLELEARLAATSSAVSASERTLHAFGFSEEDIVKLQTELHTGGRVTLRSPIAGNIVSRDARIGMQVSTETDLFHVVDLKRLRVQIDIPEQHIRHVAAGTTVAILSHNGGSLELAGKIDRIGGSIEHETRTVTAYVSVNNPDGYLRPGGFVTVRIEQSDDSVAVLAVHEEALFKDEHGDQAIYIEGEPGVFALREVETGDKVGRWTTINSGVTAGERVVTKGAFAVKSEADKSKFGDGHNH